MAEHGLACAGIDHKVTGIVEDFRDLRGNDLLALLFVFFDYVGALRLAYALDDDLLCGLGGEASEGLGFDLGFDDVAFFVLFRYLACLLH